MRVNGFVPDSGIFEKMDTNIKGKEDKSSSFSDLLKEGLDSVNEKQINSEDMTQKLIKGENVEVHQVMLATEEAKLSLQMAVQVRNKIVEAYQELNRMQL